MADERASVIELIRVVEAAHPYPWRFAITHKGVRHVFAGLPNQCATPGQALKRASKRLKWLDDGTYSERYK